MTEHPIGEQARRGRALVALHGAVALFGFAGLFGKWLALPPVTIVFGRTLVASVALALLLRVTREPAARAGNRNRRNNSQRKENHGYKTTQFPDPLGR